MILKNASPRLGLSDSPLDHLSVSLDDRKSCSDHLAGAYVWEYCAVQEGGRTCLLPPCPANGRAPPSHNHHKDWNSNSLPGARAVSAFNRPPHLQRGVGQDASSRGDPSQSHLGLLQQ